MPRPQNGAWSSCEPLSPPIPAVPVSLSPHPHSNRKPPKAPPTQGRPAKAAQQTQKEAPKRDGQKKRRGKYKKKENPTTTLNCIYLPTTHRRSGLSGTQLFRTSNHNLWTAIKMSLASLFFHFTPRLFLMMVRLGAKKLRSRPHNYRFDLWQHFRSQLLRTRWKKT